MKKVKKATTRWIEKANRSLSSAREHFKAGKYSSSDSRCWKAMEYSISAYIAEAGDGSDRHECSVLRLSLRHLFTSGPWPAYTRKTDDSVREGSAALLKRTEHALEWIGTTISSSHPAKTRSRFLRLGEQIQRMFRWNTAEPDTGS